MFRKFAIFITLIASASIMAFAATMPTANYVSVTEEPEALELAEVEVKPTFPGGEAAMYKFLCEQIQYPAAAVEDGASGKVIVQFVIEKDGSVSNVKVLRGKHPALDREAVRVVKLMPDWTPGRLGDKPVRCIYCLPINFSFN